MHNGDIFAPRVFFSYSYRDKDELKPIFLQACQEIGVVPVFAEDVRMEENVAQKLHHLILSCDAMVAIITQHFSAAKFFEISYSQSINKPLFLFAKREEPISFAFSNLRVFYYESGSEMFQRLLSSFSWLKLQSARPESVQRKKEENKIMDNLKNSLQQNVLVLGKDSDPEGIAQLDRIMSVLTVYQYVPVKLKDLPEITFLSPEDKMTRIGGQCRFIIAEDSRPSGHIDELRLCAECQYITATVREAGTAATWMQAHYPLQYSFMNRFCYCDKKKGSVKDSLCKSVSESIETATERAINWAERRIKIQEAYFSRNIYSNSQH